MFSYLRKRKEENSKKKLIEKLWRNSGKGKYIHLNKKNGSIMGVEEMSKKLELS